MENPALEAELASLVDLDLSDFDGVARGLVGDVIYEQFLREGSGSKSEITSRIRLYLKERETSKMSQIPLFPFAEQYLRT